MIGMNLDIVTKEDIERVKGDTGGFLWDGKSLYYTDGDSFPKQIRWLTMEENLNCFPLLQEECRRWLRIDILIDYMKTQCIEIDKECMQDKGF